MLGIIFAVVVIGGRICMVIAGTTKDEETKQLAVKGIADAAKAALAIIAIVVLGVAGGVYFLIKVLH